MRPGTALLVGFVALISVGGLTACTAHGDGDAADAGKPPATSTPPVTANSVPPSAGGASAISPETNPAGADGAVINPVVVPERPIPGVDSAAVVRAWNATWKATLKREDNLYAGVVDFPPTGKDLQLLVRLSNDQTTPGVASDVRCTIGHAPGRVPAAALTEIVDKCLGPALRDDERKPVLAWLSKQKYGVKGVTRQRFDRFTVEAFKLVGASSISLVANP